MKGKDPATLFYISDWLVSTNEMDADCRGWYLNLILNHYDKGSLPNDIEKLASLANVKFSEFKRFKQVFEQVLKHKFVQNDEGRLVNESAKAILKAREEFKDKRSDAGKKSYLMRYFRREYPKQSADIDIYDYVSDNIDLDIDTKNEQMIKQMFEHLFELYINENRDINKDINKEGGTGETKPKNDIDMDIINRLNLEPLLIPVVYDWLKYKRTRSESYKSDKSVSLFIANLTKYSGGDISKARQIIEQSMANNWAGIFELKQPARFGTPQPETSVNKKWGR